MTEPIASSSKSFGAASFTPPSKWNHIPEELLLQIFSYLDFDSLVASAGVCSSWHDVFRAYGFSRALYLDDSNASRHAYLLRRHGASARHLSIFNVTDLERVIKILNSSAKACDRSVLKSMTLAGSENKGAFHPAKWDFEWNGVEVFFTNDKLFLTLDAFLEKTHRDDDEMVRFLSSKSSPRDDKVLERRRSFKLEQLSLIHLYSGVPIRDRDYEMLWYTLRRRLGSHLKRLDLLYFCHSGIHGNWIPKLKLPRLEQLSISSNMEGDGDCLVKLSSALPRLEHLIVHSTSYFFPSITLSEEPWTALLEARPDTKISFLIRSSWGFENHVPSCVPVYGLEVLLIYQLSDALKEKMLVAERLALMMLTIYRPDELLDFFETLSTYGSACRLRKFQYFGEHSATYYLRLAERLALIPSLEEWVICVDQIELPQAHSTLAHESFEPLIGTRRRVAGDDRSPLLCSVGSFPDFYRSLTLIFPREKLRILTRNAFLSTSMFWKTDPQILSRLRRRVMRLDRKKRSPDCEVWGSKLKSIKSE